MEFTIRRATEKDFLLIQALNAALFVSDSPNDDALNVNWPHSPEGVSYYHQKLSGPAYGVFIAEDQAGKPLGYVIGMATNKFRYRTVKTGELENMFIVPGARRKGVGKALVARLKRWMKSKGGSYVRVRLRKKRAGNPLLRCLRI